MAGKEKENMKKEKGGEAREAVTLQLGEHFFLSSVDAAQAGAL